MSTDLVVEYAITLSRSELGDGGWSLHAHRLGVTDEDAQIEYPLLLSGEAEMVDGRWSRPLPTDYTIAQARATQLAEQYVLESV